VGMLSTFIQSIGQIVQKKGHMLALRSGTSFICNPTWMLGQSLNLIAVPIFVVSISNTSQTAQSILPALSIILITIWSCILLGSEFTRWEALSMTFLIPATIILFIFSSVEKQDIHSDELESYVYSTGAITLLVLAFVLNAAGGLIVYHILERFEQIKARILQLSGDSTNFSTRDTDAQTLQGSMTRTERSGTTLAPSIDILSYKWSAIPLIYFSYFASFFGTISNTMLRGLTIIVDDDYLNHEDGDERFGAGSMVGLVIINIALMFISLFYLNK